MVNCVFVLSAFLAIWRHLTKVFLAGEIKIELNSLTYDYFLVIYHTFYKIIINIKKSLAILLFRNKKIFIL